MLTVRYVPFLILEYDASERKVSQRENEISSKKRLNAKKEVAEKRSSENKRRLQFR